MHAPSRLRAIAGPTTARHDWLVLVLSATLAPAAFMLTTFLHELAHALTMLALDVDAVTIRSLSTDVEGDALTGAPRAVAVVAGPAFTLAIGVAAGQVAGRLERAKRLPVQLALAWIESLAFAAVSVAVALAAFPTSDGGQLLQLAGAPAWAPALLVPLGIALLVFAAGSLMARRFAALLPRGARTAVLAGWFSILLTQAALLQSAEWLFVACMALSAVPTLLPAASPPDAGRGTSASPANPRATPVSAWTFVAGATCIMLALSLLMRDGLQLG